jgi:hypothetical protein
MKKIMALLAVAVLFTSASLVVRADDTHKIDIKGMAQCAKCALKETKECQNVVVVKDGDKETKYYLVQNDVAKKAHGSAGFCSAEPGEGPMVKVVGTCEEKDGKHMVTATSIEKVEK